MNKILTLCLVTVFLAISVTLAGAANFQVNQPLVHGYYYTWGIAWTIPDDERIESASLFFADIRNWPNEANDLWVHLLEDSPTGIQEHLDNQDPDAVAEDAFSGQGTLLDHWEDLSTRPQDITHHFDASELTALSAYLSNGNFGLGIDPDCYYDNSGIILNIETAHAPVPASVLLLGSGLLGLVGLRRKGRATT